MTATIEDVARVPRKGEIRLTIKKKGKKGNRKVLYLFLDPDDELQSESNGYVKALMVFTGEIIVIVDGRGVQQHYEVIGKYKDNWSYT